MRLKGLLLICVCCFIAAPAVWGQSAGRPAQPGILGYLDPRTGAFRPVPPPVEEDSDLPPATTFTGTVNLTITITVKTTALTSFTCTEAVEVVDGTTSPTIYTESDTVSATGTGTTRTCTLSIPYSWSLSTQSTDNMTISYTVSGTAGTTGLPARFNSRTPLETVKVPSSGTTTTVTASATL